MIEARGITFGYDRDAPILTDWSARFDAGEVVAVTGPSGRGKSTLLYLLGLMLKPGDGEVLIEGDSVAGLGDARRAHLRASLFGFVFQDAALDPTRTVIDNVVETALYRGEPRADAQARARELMEQFGVELRANAKPGQVSGGAGPAHRVVPGAAERPAHPARRRTHRQPRPRLGRHRRRRLPRPSALRCHGHRRHP